MTYNGENMDMVLAFWSFYSSWGRGQWRRREQKENNKFIKTTKKKKKIAESF